MSDSSRIDDLITNLSPSLDSTQFVFLSQTTDPTEAQWSACQGLVREAEGITLILPATEEHSSSDRYARISLTVHSSLEDVGLTAVVSAALARAGIAVNILAGLHHDHLYVPAERSTEAMGILKALSQQARS